MARRQDRIGHAPALANQNTPCNYTCLKAALTQLPHGMTRVLTEFCLPSTLIVDKLPDDLFQDNRRLGDHDGAAVSQRRLSASGL